MNEKISTLIDGELSDAEFETVYAESSWDVETLRCAVRYQAIGALLRGDCSDAALRVVRNRTAEKISARLAAEPHWRLPATARRRAPRIARRGAAFLGGFATAAAVALLAVFVVSPNLDVPVTGAPGQLAETPAARGADRLPTDGLPSYLVGHGEFSGSAGLNGLIAYAKILSHDAER